MEVQGVLFVRQKAWTAEESKKLESLKAQGMSNAQCAKVLGRSAGAVEQRARVLGMLVRESPIKDWADHIDPVVGKPREPLSMELPERVQQLARRFERREEFFYEEDPLLTRTEPQRSRRPTMAVALRQLFGV